MMLRWWAPQRPLMMSNRLLTQIRAAELLSKSWGDLVKLCVRCTPQMLKSKYSSDILVEIIKRCPDPAAVSEIMEMVSDACLEQEEEIVKSPLCHHHVKRILKEGVETASVRRSPSPLHSFSPSHPNRVL